MDGLGAVAGRHVKVEGEADDEVREEEHRACAARTAATSDLSGAHRAHAGGRLGRAGPVRVAPPRAPSSQLVWPFCTTKKTIRLERKVVAVSKVPK